MKKTTLIILSFWISILSFAQIKDSLKRECTYPTYAGIVNSIYSKDFNTLSNYFRLSGGNLVKTIKEKDIIDPANDIYLYDYRDEYSFCALNKSDYYHVYVEQPTGANFNLEVDIYTRDIKVNNYFFNSITEYKYFDKDIPKFYIDYYPSKEMSTPYHGLSVGFFYTIQDDSSKLYNIEFYYHQET